MASEDLAPLTRSADLGVIPYHGVDLNNYYSSPNKLFEYAIAGLPFLSNDLPFLRSIIDQYGFGVAADLSRPEAAAAAILSIVENPIKLRELRDLAEKAGEALNWENEGEKLVALYERTVLPNLGRGALRASAGNANSIRRRCRNRKIAPCERKIGRRIQQPIFRGLGPARRVTALRRSIHRELPPISVQW